MITVDTLILGGGFTALLLASKFDSPTIVSKDLGGLLGRFGEDDFKFDIGGHVYTLGDERVARLMKESNARVFEKRRAYFIPNRWRDRVEYPVQDHAEELGITLAPRPEVNEDNFMSYSISVFGPQFYREFLGPFNERVWTISPEKMACDWVRGRVKMPSEDKKDWGMNASFAYAPGDQIITRLLGNIRRISYYQETVKMINYQEHLVVTDKNVFKYKTLFDTTGLALNDAPKERQLPFNYVMSVGIGFDKKIPHDFHWAYAKLSSEVHRITLISRYYNGLAPADGDSILMEIPFRDSSSLSIRTRVLLSNSSLDRKMSIAEGLLASTGLMSIEEMREYSPVVAAGQLSRAYPIPVLGARDRVARRKRELMASNVFSLGRWGSHGYFNLQNLYDDVDATLDAFGRPAVDDSHPYFTASFYYKEG